ncbi:MAG TPA: hypothetical protein VNR89_04655 [Roseomonas sp.]|nr:hypothetical protein [Roseomonas sp.]
MVTLFKFCVRTTSGGRSSIWQIDVRHNAVYLFHEDRKISGWHISFHSDGRNHMKLSANGKDPANKPRVRWNTGRVEQMSGQRAVLGLVLSFDVGSLRPGMIPEGCEVIEAPERGSLALHFLFSNAGAMPVEAEPGARIVLDTHMRGVKRFHLLIRHFKDEESDLMMDDRAPMYRFTNGEGRERNHVSLTLGPTLNDGVAHLFERWGHMV